MFENLARPPYSIWAYLLDAVPQASRAFVPDMEDLVGHAARTIGTSVCRDCRRSTRRVGAALDRGAGATEGLRAHRLRLALRPRLRRALADAHGRDRLAQPLAAKIVMEAAIPMSKVDPATVPRA